MIWIDNIIIKKIFILQFLYDLDHLPHQFHTHHNLKRSNAQKKLDGILAGAIVSVLILILVLTTILVATVLICLKRKGTKKIRGIHLDHGGNNTSSVMNNIVYQSNATPINATSGLSFSNALYDGKLTLMHYWHYVFLQLIKYIYLLRMY